MNEAFILTPYQLSGNICADYAILNIQHYNTTIEACNTEVSPYHKPFPQNKLYYSVNPMTRKNLLETRHSFNSYFSRTTWGWQQNGKPQWILIKQTASAGPYATHVHSKSTERNTCVVRDGIAWWQFTARNHQRSSEVLFGVYHSRDWSNVQEPCRDDSTGFLDGGNGALTGVLHFNVDACRKLIRALTNNTSNVSIIILAI